jgi:hypothetical protein
MVKKGVVIALIIFIVVSGVVWYLSSRPQYVSYSDLPQDWVEKVGTVSQINVEEVTKGAGTFNVINQQYRVGLIDTAFAYEGMYNGDFFADQYYDPNGLLRAEITPNLKAGDGVLQGLIVERIENSVATIFIFLDSDWKNRFGDKLIIVWGKEYENTKKFEFNDLGNGIFYDSIIDDASRFSDDYRSSVGGAYVGDLDANAPVLTNTTTMIGLH